MTPSPLDMQPAGYKLPHDWLVSLDTNVAVLCYVQLKIAPIDAIWLFSLYAEDSVAPHHPHPYRSACGIGIASKSYLKWWAIQLGMYIHSTACI